MRRKLERHRLSRKVREKIRVKEISLHFCRIRVGHRVVIEDRRYGSLIYLLSRHWQFYVISVVGAIVRGTIHNLEDIEPRIDWQNGQRSHTQGGQQ